ncbi:MAG: hypothetical protein KF830_13480 [Planctomycetes bacterium]|nr:hypothetical protein [Planctomycetota bacterium]
MHTRPSLLAPSLCVLSLAAGCADGGKEDRPQSEVRISATHHLFGFRSLGGFGSFPIRDTVVFTDRGRLNLFDDSRYTITRPSGTSASDRYALEKDGTLGIFVTGGGSEPSVLFRGAYAQAGPASVPAVFQFTDRVATPSSPSLGLYYGTRVVTGQVELAGGWHLLSLHVVFDQTILSPENVGRGVRGGVSIATGDPGTVRAVSGTGTQGTSTQGTSAVTFTGSIQNLLDGGASGDGSCNLTLGYNADSRVMFAAATDNIVYALDADETDDEAGVVFLVRKFDAPASPVDASRVPGSFLVGGHTLFVNPSNPGSDAFTGVVQLSSGGGFRLDAVGSSGAAFAYAGTYTLSPDGGLTISINGTNENWFAAIDRDYQTLALVDDFVEVRSNNTPELNVALGVRRKLP